MSKQANLVKLLLTRRKFLISAVLGVAVGNFAQIFRGLAGTTIAKGSIAEHGVKAVINTSEPFTLCSVVKDQAGNPVPGAIYVTGLQFHPLASLHTDENGVYSTPIPACDAAVD